MKPFATITLTTGDKIEIISPTFREVSIIMRKYQKQENEEDALDLMFFFAKEVCLFNGKKKGGEFVANLSADIYFLITKEINTLLLPIL